MRPKIDSRIRNLIKRNSKVILTATREEYPFVPERGDGDFVYDISGNKFIDFSSFVSVYNMGVNGNKEIRKAIHSQVDKLMHAAFTDYYAELPVKFAENLMSMMPSGFGKLFFSNSGTEANEAAIKFSRIFTKRQYMLSFYGSFHGRTLGSLALTADQTVHKEHFGPFNSALHAPFAYCYRCPFGKEYPGCGIACADYVKDYVLKKDASPKEVAAIFIEPVQGEGGYVVPPKEFVVEMRKIADEHGIILVSDEIQAGYMRTGKFLGLDNFGVKADIYTMAKSVGAGLPMGVTIVNNSLGDIPKGAHANTFGGNLAAMAGAEASLNYLKSHMKTIESNVKANGKMMMKRLNEMKERYEIIGDVRGLGMMIGVEFVKSKKTKEPAVKERESILVESFNNGVILLPAGVSTIRIIPPLTISKEHLEEGLDMFENAVRKVSGSPFL